MLGLLGWRFLELEKIIAQVVGHDNITGACDVVPGNGETKEQGTVPIDRYTVEFLEVLDEAVGIFFAKILYAKRIHHKGESDGFGAILPKGRGAGNRHKAELRNV